jgi:hypothetical protein
MTPWAGDDLYVRSAYGRTSAWFRGAQTRHEGRIRSGGVEKDVAFVDSDHDLDEIDAMYAPKYRRYRERFVSLMTSREARDATLKLVPRSSRKETLCRNAHLETATWRSRPSGSAAWV